MKKLLTAVLVLSAATMSFAQGTLQFNQIKIIGNSAETVPAGKGWKITAVYGAEFRVNECVNFHSTSTHEIGTRVRCAWNADRSRQFSYNIGTFKINGVSIVSSISGFGDGPLSTYWTTNDCSGSASSSSSTFTWSCVNKDPDPNILPIWVPAGSTVESGGPNTFVSVLEFNIIP